MSCGGAISLEASVRTCDVNVGEANRIQSDRFFNPNNMVCVPWNGVNNKGQEVCPDSFYTKTPGCDSAEDRVMVENAQRPKYINYVTLSAAGIGGHIYGNVSAAQQTQARQKWLNTRDNNKFYGGSGNFGTQWGANVQYSKCGLEAYERGQAQLAQAQRNTASMQHGYQTHQNRQASGGW